VSERAKNAGLVFFITGQLVLLVCQARPQFHFQRPRLAWFHWSGGPSAPAAPSASWRYDRIISSVERTRARSGAAYRRAGDDGRKQALLARDRDYLLAAVAQAIFPAWYGTPWGFSGRTEAPRAGTIACGIFVTTVLNHAGFDLDRIRLGVQPSGYIIANLTGEENVLRMSGRPVEAIREEVRRRGKNLYIVGLDKHAGFIYYDGKTDPVFVHSSHQKGVRKVVCEKLDESEPFRKSKYKILGRMFDDRMMESWVCRRPIPLSRDFYVEHPHWRPRRRL